VVTVVISQRRLPHYRVPLFELLRTELASRNIRLELLLGHGTASEEKKRDSGSLDWAKQVPIHYFAGDRVCWQPLYRHLRGADLVIVSQENALLANHLLMLCPRSYKLAFWGHGANLQSSNPYGLKEVFKRWTTNQVDWWFTYTAMSTELVTTAGFPASRITEVNNSVDTSELRRQKESVTAEETRALRDSLGFGDGPVGVFVGSLYEAKRMDFLFAAAEEIRRDVADFHLLIIGDGPQGDKVQASCNARPWACWAGSRLGREKAAYISMAKLMLNPGLVGLGILDAFICGVPIITTDCGSHSPEIAYLKNGVNGIMTANSLGDYARSAVCLLREASALNGLKAGCVRSSAEYTVEKMAHRFADGIETALYAPCWK
jgi:L-malate glycosyltransferase